MHIIFVQDGKKNTQEHNENDLLLVVGPVVSDVCFQITFFTSWHLMSYQARSNQRKLHRNSTSWQWSFYSMTLKWGLSVSAPQYLLLVWANVLYIRQETYTLIYIYLCKKWEFRSSIWLVWSQNIRNVQPKCFSPASMSSRMRRCCPRVTLLGCAWSLKASYCRRC